MINIAGSEVSTFAASCGGRNHEEGCLPALKRCRGRFRHFAVRVRSRTDQGNLTCPWIQHCRSLRSIRRLLSRNEIASYNCCFRLRSATLRAGDI